MTEGRYVWNLEPLDGHYACFLECYFTHERMIMHSGGLGGRPVLHGCHEAGAPRIRRAFLVPRIRFSEEVVQPDSICKQREPTELQ